MEGVCTNDLSLPNEPFGGEKLLPKPNGPPPTKVQPPNPTEVQPPNVCPPTMEGPCTDDWSLPNDPLGVLDHANYGQAPTSPMASKTGGEQIKLQRAVKLQSAVFDFGDAEAEQKV